MTGTSAPGWSAAPSYDAAGDVSNDGRNAYLYDAEGRICAVNNGNVQIGYLYDAAGNRVAKGTISSWSCDITSNGFQQTAGYVVDGGGQQLSEVDSNNNWTHTNVWANGKLVGTYDSAGLHFHFDDPLGTRRVQASAAGVIEATYQSLPYGDGFAASGSAADPTENHFTGKERDAESGNDFMFARYYNSATGRFFSPDWSAKVQPVPYAKLGDPQSLNLYSYVGNNPVGRMDANGQVAAGTPGCTQGPPKCHPGNSGLKSADVNRGIAIGGIEAARSAVKGAASAVSPALAPLINKAINAIPTPKPANSTQAGISAVTQFALGVTAGVATAGAGAAAPAPSVAAESAMSPMARGLASEERVLADLGLVKNTTGVSTEEGNAIPDALTDSASYEIKDSACVYCTRQVRIETDAAAASGRESVLITGTNTYLSGPAQDAFDQIIRRDDLGPPSK